MAKVSLGATIPVTQYGNLQPVIEAEGETYEEAMEVALQRMYDLWNRTSEKPLNISRDVAQAEVKILTCWASGTEVAFDPAGHTYRVNNGPKWLGGSTFAERYVSAFPGPLIAGKMADKNGVEARDILDMWGLNAFASATVGTAVHAALQLRGVYGELSQKVKDGSFESALSSNPILRPIVEAFFEGREGEVAVYEAFVADAKRRHCGQIDRILIEDDGLWVEDFKTNASLTKSETILEPFKGVVPNNKLGAFLLQLSFYARILKAHGKTVKGLRIHHWTGEQWETHEHEVIDIESILNESNPS